MDLTTILSTAGTALSGVIAAAAVIAPHLAPPSSATGAYAVVYAVVNAVAQNYRYAKNAATPPAA